MSYRNIFSSFFVSIGLIFFSSLAFAESDPSSKFRVLSAQGSALNISTISAYLDQAEVSIKAGNSDEAAESLKKARTVSNLLIDYYKDIIVSFRGVDALIPRQMRKKNLDVIQLLGTANLQLATIHRSEGKPELAVPLLVDVLKILTPTDPKGAEAYQQLFELGFVETPYLGDS